MNVDEELPPGDPHHPKGDCGRRTLLLALGAGAGRAALKLIVPAAWATPLVVAMEIPAHAECSAMCQQSHQPPSGSTLAADASISTETKGNVVTLVIRPPADVIANRTQFYVIAQYAEGWSNATTVATFTPGTDPEQSKEFRLDLPPNQVSYQYSLRWTGHHTEAVVVGPH